MTLVRRALIILFCVALLLSVFPPFVSVPAQANPEGPIDNPGTNALFPSVTNMEQEYTWSPWIYDWSGNYDGLIGYEEMINALMDYLVDKISFPQMIDVLMCYLSGDIIGETYSLQIDSTSGGNVTTPGEGPFGPYDEGEVVNLVADADSGYHFSHWSGDNGNIADTNDPTTTITMHEYYSITANFVPDTLSMVPIPGGSFQMGDLSGDGYSGELPVHTVTLSPFEMAQYELTYEKWMEVKTWAESHGYSFDNEGAMGGEDYGGTQNETHPVTTINWYDTAKWCNALSEMEWRAPCYYTSGSQTTVYRSGRIDVENNWVDWDANGYRLLTEAEWEYACRATTTKYSFGNTIDGDDANYGSSGDSYDNGTTPVGYYPANAWGLYDMHGNVWEWCWDWYDYSYYSSSPTTDPIGPSVGSYRVDRGGSWYISTVNLRSASRYDSHPDNEGGNVGFRPVRSS